MLQFASRAAVIIWLSKYENLYLKCNFKALNIKLGVMVIISYNFVMSCKNNSISFSNVGYFFVNMLLTSLNTCVLATQVLFFSKFFAIVCFCGLSDRMLYLAFASSLLNLKSGIFKPI